MRAFNAGSCACNVTTPAESTARTKTRRTKKKDFMTVRRFFELGYSRFRDRLLVDIAEEIIQRLIHLHVHIHIDLNGIDRVVSLDAEASAQRNGKAEGHEDKKALHGRKGG